MAGTGRGTNDLATQFPRVNRLCPTCGSNQTEDEIHLRFHCPKYSIFRDRFYRKLECHLPYIKRLSTLEVTKELMNSDNYFVNIQLLRFILSCLNLRNNIYYQFRLMYFNSYLLI